MCARFFHFGRMLVPTIFVVAIFGGTLHGETSGGTLRVGLLPNLSRMEMLTTFSPFIKALEDETGMEVKAVSGKDYSAIISMLKHKELDICMLGGFPLLTVLDDFGAKVFVRNLEVTSPGGPPGEAYHSVIITRKDSGIASLEDLKGKRFAFTDPKSSSGFLFPMVALIRHGIRSEDLGGTIYVKKHPNVLLAVSNRRADAGALSEDILVRGTGVDPDRLAILWRSEPIMHGPWVARKDFPDGMLRMVRAAFLAISARKDAARIFSESYIKGFVPAKVEDYDNVREVMDLKKALEKKKDVSGG